MKIRIIRVEKDSSNPKYQALAVAYRNLDTGKTQSSKIMSFGNPDVFKALDTLSDASNSIWNVQVVTNAKGYPEWATIHRLADEAVTDVAETGRTIKKDWETREERAARQILIVRQSSLATAVDIVSSLHSADPKTHKFDVDGILATAEALEAWVFRKPEVNVEEAMKALANS